MRDTQRNGVPPVDIYAVFGKPNRDRVCLECEALGHICRPCRAARYYERQAPPPSQRSLIEWWRSTTLYAMNRDYPLATPLLFAAGAWWACVALILGVWALGR